MSSATLASPRAHAAPVHPDRIRIAALSVALAVNSAVLVYASRALPPMVLAFPHAARALRARWIDPPRPVPEVPPPPPPVTRPLLRTPPTPVHPLPMPMTATPPLSLPEAGRIALPPVAPHPTLAPPGATGMAGTATGERSLAYRSAPLRYPPEAARRHLQGTVLLRVLVDSRGRPLRVEVERSSGNPLLDRSAREQVLASWRFEPAQEDGHAVDAWARVPVRFALREL